MHEFDIIKSHKQYADIYAACESLEQAASAEERALEARKVLEEVLKFIYQKENRKYPLNATMLERINNSVMVGFVDNEILLESLHFVRKLGMNAQHGLHIKKKQAQVAYDNLTFFIQYVYKKYEEPERVKTIVLPKYMSEADTRRIYIDTYLKEAGWDVLPPVSKTVLPDGTEVDSGMIFPEKACCEIPVYGMHNKSGIGFCDYVLYGKDGKPLAIVEAKKTSIEAMAGYKQVKEYGAGMEKAYGYIPVLYYTNGYEIYVLDGLYPSRQVMAFHSREELEYMIQKRERKDITDLRINDEISGRPYQKMAVTNVCERFNGMFRRSLIVMATGTGKTRVSISLVDVLLRNNWIKRVLFLADRTSLVEQAFKNFKKLLPDMSYCVLSNRALADEPDARMMFSTHQTMIGYIDAEDKEFTCGHFDLIIVDESHRSVFNKYGAIFEYFDALLVGLTATPKDEVDANTYQLFNCETGEPNYAYSLEEAVREKYLVPYKVESRTTRLLKDGIKYKDLSPEDRQKAEAVFLEEDMNDDFVIPKQELFQQIYNIDTCGKVLDDLMEHGLRVSCGEEIGKTIIFAYNHKHAELIVQTFRKCYPNFGNDYCQLIDNQVKNANHLIEEFEEKDYFRIAVSVDMLDTGIDVPGVLNLVFFKPVKSKIKFIQMIGRGTRLCEGLMDGKDKSYFLIFDYCGNFEYFDLHPEGANHDNEKSLSQKLFDLRLDILVELQSYQHQSDLRCKLYYEKLKQELYRKTRAIKAGSERLSVRKEMSFVDKYVDYDNWQAIAPLAKKEIQLHLSKLVGNERNQDVRSLKFDMQMLDIELSVLANGGVSGAQRQVERVRVTAKYLLEYAAGIPSVMGKADSLKTLAGVDFWDNPRIDSLEKYREEIRDLMKYLSPRTGTAVINAVDEVESGEYKGSSLIDIRTYKEKVIDYLAEHIDNQTIRKIQNLEPIDSGDLRELERILWHELGTREEYQKATNIDNLAAFIRSIVGIDQSAMNEKFGDFLNDNVLNSKQQEFVKAIIDYVRENGDIQTQDLLETAPFANYDFLSLFGSNVVKLANFINILHGSIMVA